MDDVKPSVVLSVRGGGAEQPPPTYHADGRPGRESPLGLALGLEAPGYRLSPHLEDQQEELVDELEAAVQEWVERDPDFTHVLAAAERTRALDMHHRNEQLDSAGVAEQADAPGLNPGAARRAGSSPVAGTKSDKGWLERLPADVRARHEAWLTSPRRAAMLAEAGTGKLYTSEELRIALGLTKEECEEARIRLAQKENFDA